MIAESHSVRAFGSLQVRSLLTVSEAAHRFNLSPTTLRSWTTGENPRLATLRTLGGHRRIEADAIARLLGMTLEGQSEGLGGAGGTPVAAVIRVSSAGQSRAVGNSDKSSLDHQRERVQSYIAEHYPQAHVAWYSSVGSGLNFEREAFLKLTTDILDGKFRGGVIVATDFTRICRFGIKLFEHICGIGGARIEYSLVGADERNENESLVDDVLSVLTHFTAKVSGRKNKAINETAMSADQLKDAYLWYRDGMSYLTVAERLEKEGRGAGVNGKPITKNVVMKRLKENWDSLARLYKDEGGDSPNSFTRFVRESVRKVKGSNLNRMALLEAYEGWCKTNDLQPLTDKCVTRQIRRLGWRIGEDDKGCLVYKGIALTA